MDANQFSDLLQRYRLGTCSEEEKEQETTKTKGRSTRGRIARAKIEASSSDED